MKPRLNKENILIGIGLSLVLFGGFINVYWPKLLRNLVHKDLILTKDSKSFKGWTSSSVPMMVQFYFWNWTNAADYGSEDYIPHFEQVGPYKYRESIDKVNITWNSNGTITYKRLRRWYFDPENSNGTLKDEITTLDVVAVTAAFKARYWNSWILYGFSMAMPKKLYVTKTVSQLLFEGYSDTLINAARTLPGIGDAPFDRFGWFYKRNGSIDSDGVFNMETGANGIHDIGVLRNWNYADHTPFYKGQCNRVQGSAGEFWHPERTRNDHVTLFTADICRYITFYYSEDVQVSEIPAYKYRSGSLMMDNGTIDPMNTCFCGGECVPSGVLNISSCRYGAPGFVSYPHFYLADPYYRNAISGMNPDPEKHDSFIILEPFTGVPLEVAARFQINILLQPHKEFTLLKDVPRVFVPILWFEQHVLLPEDIASEMRLLLKMPSAGNIGSIGIILIGILIIGVTIARRYFSRRSVLTITYKPSKTSGDPSGLDKETGMPVLSSEKAPKEEIKLTESNIRPIPEY